MQRFKSNSHTYCNVDMRELIPSHSVTDDVIFSPSVLSQSVYSEKFLSYFY